MIDTLTEEQITKYQEAFQMFDSDGVGSISTNYIGTVMNNLGYTTTEEELNSMINEVDQNGQGIIDFREFLSLMAKMLNVADIPITLE
jgi:calmodulin